MPLSTNLNVSPYFDDYNPQSNYYKILYKPATAVQVREMNQMQTILQNQIERFGDNILKSGTILEGCQFSFETSMPFVKVLDRTEDGAAADVTRLLGFHVESESGDTKGLKARIERTVAGFEGNAPDLNTLYIKYINSKNAEDTFAAGDVLRVYSPRNQLYNIRINASQAGFANNDTLIITSAILVKNPNDGQIDWANNFVDEEVFEDAAGTARIQLYDTPTFDEETNTVTLKVKPLTEDLQSYTQGGKEKIDNVRQGVTLIGQQSGNEVVITELVGAGASGTFTTSATGQISSTTILTNGSGYEVLPHVTIASSSASTQQINSLSLIPEEYITRLVVPLDSVAAQGITGFGFGINVTDGQIYQKGYFLNVQGQFAFVSKYSNTPSDVAVGFNTEESIVNAFADSTLFDNAESFLNFAAPGADRLTLQPKLVALTFNEAEQNNTFFPLVKFSEGRPYAQQKMTAYNKLQDVMAQRTYEESGNYVLDEFNMTTKSIQEFANTADSLSYIIDPGHAYINGYRVRTQRNYTKNVSKGTELKIETRQGVDVDYGYYTMVEEMAGMHAFKAGQLVQLRSAPGNYLSNVSAINNPGGTETIPQPGAQIGTARIRSVVFDSGIQGTPTAKYKVYLFDIRMNNNKKFIDVKSIYSPAIDVNGVAGIADTVQTLANDNILRALKESGSNTSVEAAYRIGAKLYEPKKNTLVYSTKRPVKELSNVEYLYRTSGNGFSIVNTDGSISITAPSGTTFPYSGQLNSSEEKDLILIPEINMESNVAPGTGPYTATSGTLNASNGLVNDLRVGDYLTDGTNVVRVTRIVSDTTAKYTPAVNLSAVNFVFPANVPIDLSRSTRFVQQTASNQLLVQTAVTFPSAITSSTITATFNVKVTDSGKSQFTVNRSKFVKVDGTTAAPWLLGVPGIIRLRSVTAGVGGADITNNFYIDHNQNENYYDYGYLYLKKGSNYTPTGDLVVEFDYLSPDSIGGIKFGGDTNGSYPVDDTKTLDQSTTTINTAEIPEMIGNESKYYDLRECFDFRPVSAATVTPAATAGAAPYPSAINEATRFDGTDLKFPVPESDLFFDVVSYLPRYDEIAVTNEGNFNFNIGTKELKREQKPNQLPLFSAHIPPYPSYPAVKSPEILEFMNNGVLNILELGRRNSKYTARVKRLNNQTLGYTMAEIGKLERRIKALEYQVGVTKLENQVTNLTIQSSVDSTLERFKFGFFVDNFEDYKFTNFDDPEYDASIYQYVLSPSKTSVNIKFKVDSRSSSSLIEGNKITFPGRRKRLLSQKNATYASVPVEPPEPTIEMFCEFVQTQTDTNIGDKPGTYSTYVYAFEESTVTCANFSDDVQRNIEIRGYCPQGGVAFRVSQSSVGPTPGVGQAEDKFGGGPGITLFDPVADNYQSLPSNEAIELYQKLYPVYSAKGVNRSSQLNTRNIIPYSVNPWFEPLSPSTFPLNSFTYKAPKGAFKISIPYDHTKGRFVTITAIKKNVIFNYEVCYPAEAPENLIYDQGGDVYTKPPCPKGTYKYEKCVGDNLYTYVCDGNYGITVGDISYRNSKCYTAPTTTPSPTTPPNEQTETTGPTPCPPAGTISSTRCSTDGTYTYIVYEHLGFRLPIIGCAVKKSVETPYDEVNCGPIPGKEDPCPTTTEVVTPPPQDSGNEDGCTITDTPNCPAVTGNESGNDDAIESPGVTDKPDNNTSIAESAQAAEADSVDDPYELDGSQQTATTTSPDVGGRGNSALSKLFGLLNNY